MEEQWGTTKLRAGTPFVAHHLHHAYLQMEK